MFSAFSKKSAIPNKKGIILFLASFFFYIDGVYTIIDMATSFGGALGFDITGLLMALLLTQVIAFPSAIIFGKLAPKVSNEVLIFVCIIAYTGVALFAMSIVLFIVTARHNRPYIKRAVGQSEADVPLREDRAQNRIQ